MRLIDADKLIYQSHAQHLLPYIDKKDIDNAPTVEVAKDCISREAVEEITWEEPSYDDALNVLTEVRDKVRALPSVPPKFTDEEIQKMQELEQAQLDKAYELGKTDSFEEWLASFNTESATCCFTAVQELKKRLEGEG